MTGSNSSLFPRPCGVHRPRQFRSFLSRRFPRRTHTPWRLSCGTCRPGSHGKHGCSHGHGRRRSLGSVSRSFPTQRFRDFPLLRHHAYAAPPIRLDRTQARHTCRHHGAKMHVCRERLRALPKHEPVVDSPRTVPRGASSTVQVSSRFERRERNGLKGNPNGWIGNETGWCGRPRAGWSWRGVTTIHSVEKARWSAAQDARKRRLESVSSNGRGCVARRLLPTPTRSLGCSDPPSVSVDMSELDVTN